MTTATAPRIIASSDGGHAIIANNDCLLTTGKHDWSDESRVSVRGNPAATCVTIDVSNATEHASIWLNREDARLIAQAILDATA